MASKVPSVPSRLRVRTNIPNVLFFVSSELRPRSAALRDPQARKEVETRLKDLARQGTFITEAARELDEILTMRGGTS